MNTMAKVPTDSARQIPGELGIWIFIMSDMLMFALLFVLYAIGQARDPAGFHASQNILNKDLGLLNTVLLLTSSWFVALAVDSAAKNAWRTASNFIALGMVCGVGFMIVKTFEYVHKIVSGYTLISDEFFSYYFIITGIHFVHVTIGLVVLGFLWRSARQKAPKSLSALESGACYWHMVDLLWIAIFPLLYLLH